MTLTTCYESKRRRSDGYQFEIRKGEKQEKLFFLLLIQNCLLLENLTFCFHYLVCGVFDRPYGICNQIAVN